jgi:futalosine hydrolase
MMKKYLIIIPTLTEASPFISKMGMEKCSSNLYSNKISDTDLLICGPGMPASIVNCAIHLINSNYKNIILAGIAGSYTKDINIGQTVCIREENFADIGFQKENNYNSLFHLADWETEYGRGNIKNAHTDWMKSTKLTLVNSNTVNLTNIQLDNLATADIENMEGAGIFLLAKKLNLPILEIRSISNYVRERDKSNWNINLATDNLSIEILKIINS